MWYFILTEIPNTIYITFFFANLIKEYFSYNRALLGLKYFDFEAL